MSYKGRTIGEIYAEKRPGERQYDACMRLGCQERAKGGVECRELCERASPVLTRQPLPEGLVTRHRPRASAGVSTMAELMRRSRVERDFGGVEDE